MYESQYGDPGKGAGQRLKDVFSAAGEGAKEIGQKVGQGLSTAYDTGMGAVTAAEQGIKEAWDRPKMKDGKEVGRTGVRHMPREMYEGARARLAGAMDRMQGIEGGASRYTAPMGSAPEEYKPPTPEEMRAKKQTGLEGFDDEWGLEQGRDPKGPTMAEQAATGPPEIATPAPTGPPEIATPAPTGPPTIATTAAQPTDVAAPAPPTRYTPEQMEGYGWGKKGMETAYSALPEESLASLHGALESRTPYDPSKGGWRGIKEARYNQMMGGMGDEVVGESDYAYPAGYPDDVVAAGEPMNIAWQLLKRL